jgi:glycosyltransferase involved in cell wall biosynthesis
MCRISGVAKRVALYSVGDIGSTMSGPGIRYYHLAQELAGAFDVTLMTPNEPDIEVPHVRLVPAAGIPPETLGRMLGEFDAVVAQKLPDPVARRLARTDVRVIYDLYVPLLSEHLAMLAVELQHPSSVRFTERAMLTQRLALVTGDAFVCASERQRDFWLGMLATLGRVDVDAYAADPTLRGLIDVVPFGLPAEPPLAGEPVLKGVVDGIAATDHVLLWGGGVWNWFDPLTVIRAVDSVAQRRDDVKLLFLGLRHPQVPAMAMAGRALDLAKSRGLLGRVVFANEGWVAYGERQRFLLEADIGVSAHFDSVETRYAFRTRLLDYFWAGLPTISTRGDVLGDLIAGRALGRTPGAGDVDAWARAIEELLEPAEHARARANVEAVRAEYAWPRVAAPLVRLVGSPGVRVRNAPRELELRVEEVLLRLRTSYEIRGVGGFVRSRFEKLGRRR